MSSRIIVVLQLRDRKIFSSLTWKKKIYIYIYSTEYVISWKEKAKKKMRVDNVHVVVCVSMKNFPFLLSQ